MFVGGEELERGEAKEWRGFARERKCGLGPEASDGQIKAHRFLPPSQPFCKGTSDNQQANRGVRYF